MGSFQAKIGWKRLKKRENKNYRFVSFRSYTTHKRWFKKKIGKKIQKIKKPSYGFFSSQNRWEKAEKKRKKNLSFRSVPPWRVIKNSKKEWQENWKILKKTIMASFQAKTGWKRLKKRENKNYRFVSSLPDA